MSSALAPAKSQRGTCSAIKHRKPNVRPLPTRDHHVNLSLRNIAFTAMVCFLLAALSLLCSPLASTYPLDGRSSDTDPFAGKKLTPTNYTVVPNVFIQDSPAFNTTGYNLLNDSFGLIDKSPGRWQNFTKSVSQSNISGRR